SRSSASDIRSGSSTASSLKVGGHWSLV
ncbi:hypothetical protein D030_4167B, partial [Vibrio parahaemolyticus AQ3810]